MHGLNFKNLENMLVKIVKNVDILNIVKEGVHIMLL